MIEWKELQFDGCPGAEARHNGVDIRISQYGTNSRSAGKWFWSALSRVAHTSGIVETREDAVAITETIAEGGEPLVKKYEAERLLGEINRITQEIINLDLDDFNAAAILPGYHVGLKAGYVAARRETAMALGMTLPDEVAA